MFIAKHSYAHPGEGGYVLFPPLPPPLDEESLLTPLQSRPSESYRQSFAEK